MQTWTQTTVVPGQFAGGQTQLGQIVAGGEAVGDFLGAGAGVGHQHRAAAEDSGGRTQLQTCEGHGKDVVGHIAEGTRTERPPSAEVPGCVGFVIRTHLGGTDEGFPVHGAGHGLNLGGSAHSLRPDGTVGESLDTGHFANLAVPEPVDGLASTRAGSSLVTLLRGHFVLGSQTGEQAALVGIQRHGFLYIHVLAGLNGIGCDDGVGMVSRSHHDSICRLQHFIVHLTVVVVLLCIGIAVQHGFSVLPVAVAEANDVLGLCHFGNVSGTASADADSEDVQFVGGSFLTDFCTQYRAGDDGGGNNHARQRSGAALQEISSCEVCHSVWFFMRLKG